MKNMGAYRAWSRRIVLAAFIFGASFQLGMGAAQISDEEWKKINPQTPYKLHIFSTTKSGSYARDKILKVFEPEDQKQWRLFYKTWFQLVPTKEEAEIVLELEKSDTEQKPGYENVKVISGYLSVLNILIRTPIRGDDTGVRLFSSSQEQFDLLNRIIKFMRERYPDDVIAHGAGPAAPSKLSATLPKIEADPDVLEQIEKLRALGPLDRGNGALSLKQMGSRAAPAVPFLTAILGDNRPLELTRDLGTEGKKWATKTTPGELAMEALIAIGDSAIEGLIQALKSENEYVRRHMTLKLCFSSQPVSFDARFVEPMIAALKDKSEFVRSYAADWLGSYVRFHRRKANSSSDYPGGKMASRFVAPLITALNDRSRFVRLSAVDSLGDIGPDAQEAIPALTKLLQDKDATIREKAQKALEKIQKY